MKKQPLFLRCMALSLALLLCTKAGTLAEEVLPAEGAPSEAASPWPEPTAVYARFLERCAVRGEAVVMDAPVTIEDYPSEISTGTIWKCEPIPGLMVQFRQHKPEFRSYEIIITDNSLISEDREREFLFDFFLSMEFTTDRMYIGTILDTLRGAWKAEPFELIAHPVENDVWKFASEFVHMESAERHAYTISSSSSVETDPLPPRL